MAEHGGGRSVAPALASRCRQVLMPCSAHKAHCRAADPRSLPRPQRADGLACKCSAGALHLLAQPDGCFRRSGGPWNPEGRWKAPIDGAFAPGPGLVGRTHDQQHLPRRRRAHTVKRCACLGFAQIRDSGQAFGQVLLATACRALAAERSRTELPTRRPFLTAARSPTRSSPQRSDPIDRSRWSGPDVSESSVRPTASHCSILK